MRDALAKSEPQSMANTEVARVVEEKNEMVRKERSANLWENAFIVRNSGFLVVWLRVVAKAFTDDVVGRALVTCFYLGRCRRVRHVTVILSYQPRLGFNTTDHTR